MKKLLLIFVGILFISTAFTQTFHEDTYVKFLISKDSVISAFLRSEGGIQLGTSSSTKSGTLRWTGSDLQIYTGSTWTSVMSSLDAATVKSLYESNLNTNAFTDALWSELVTNSAHRIGNGTDHAQVVLNIDAIALNTAKISYPPADQSKLSGIESNATADQTGSEIKTLYENEANTNAFADTEKTKLGTVETNAAADQSDAEIKIAYENNANTNAFTDAEQTKLAGITAGAEINVQSDWDAATGDAFIFNKPTNLSDFNNDITELGNYSFDGDEMFQNSQRVMGLASGGFIDLMPDPLGPPISSAFNGVKFTDLTPSKIIAGGDQSAVTAKYVKDQIADSVGIHGFQETTDINATTNNALDITNMVSITGGANNNGLSIKNFEKPYYNIDFYVDETGMSRIKSDGPIYTYVNTQQVKWENSFGVHIYDHNGLFFGVDDKFSFRYNSLSSSKFELVDYYENVFMSVEDKGTDAEFRFNGSIYTDLPAAASAIDSIVGVEDNKLVKILAPTGGSSSIMPVFSGAEGNTATQNATALLSDYTGNSNVWIPEGTFDLDDVVLPAGATLYFAEGAIFNVTGTLTGDGTQVMAGQNQIFSLTSDVEGTWQPSNGMAYVEWFGAIGDGTGTGDSDAIQKTIDAFTTIIPAGKIREVGLHPYNDLGDTTQTQSVKINLLNNAYVIDKTIIIPEYCNFQMGNYTAMLGDTTNFFDSYLDIVGNNFRIDGGVFLVRTFSEQMGYKTSAQDSLAKVEFAYNENPIIRWKWWQNKGYTFRDAAVISNVRMKHTGGGYGGSISWNPNIAWYYDGIFVYADTTKFYGGVEQEPLRIGYRYYFSKYEAGDDFLNVGATVETQVDGGIFTVTGPIPTDWTNGSVLKPWAGQNIFNSFHDISIKDADTGIFLDGGPLPREHNIKKMTLSWMLSSLVTDQCVTGLVLGEECHEMSIVNYQLQCSDVGSVAGRYSMIIDGSANYISGAFSDFNYATDRAISVQGYNNVLNMAMDQRTADKVGDVILDGTSNLIGPAPLWRKTKDLTQSVQSFWFLPPSMGITEDGNTSVDRELEPSTTLDIIGANSTSTNQALMLLELANNGVKADGKLTNTQGLAGALSINDRIGTAQSDIRPSSGASIDFYVNNNRDTTGGYSDYPLGKVGFRQDYSIGYMSTTGPRGAFQIWNNDNGTWIPSMTITSDGLIGGAGVTQPSYTFDLVGDVTHNVGGVLKGGTFRSESILDDGTDVAVSSDLAVTGNVSASEAIIYAISDLLTTSRTIDNSQTYWLFNPSSAITATLPAISTNEGLKIVIYNASTTNSMTIALNGTDRIDGSTGSVTLGTNDKVTYVSSGLSAIGWIEESERIKP